MLSLRSGTAAFLARIERLEPGGVARTQARSGSLSGHAARRGQPNRDAALPVEFQPVQVETNSPDREGRLVLCGGKAVGILVKLSAHHGVFRGHWSTEWIAGLLHHPSPFPDLETAKAWFSKRFDQC